MGVPILYSGGAVLAGSYFGDRCSPMSTSALLVSTVTKTDLFRNIGNMVKPSIVPFLLTCLLYGILGIGFEGAQDHEPMRALFRESFSLSPVALIPAAVIVVLSLFRLNVKITMSISVLCSIFVCLLVEKLPLGQLGRIALFGYQPEAENVRQLLSGGGIFSMAKVFSIVCISSCFSGIFNGTGLLNGLRSILVKISKKASPFFAYLITAILTAMVACNQALATMLAAQLCQDIGEPPEKAALHMSNTVIVIAPLIPWSIAGTVALESVGAPVSGIVMAFFLYLLPVCTLITELVRYRKMPAST
jgi:NhaC family Na+:H+ antiporter